MPHDILAKIIADKKEHVAACKQRLSHSALNDMAKTALAPRDFYGALIKKHAAGETGLICEIKKASPSAGVLCPNFNVAQLAKAYEAAGAACLSVLTDTPYFQGKDADVKTAHDACTLPILRKDFMIDPYQITETRALGADCILLIVACLANEQIEEMLHCAAQHHMSILLEMHDEEEVERMLDLNINVPRLLYGINNRNLKTLVTDLGTTERLAKLIGHDRGILVSESGIKTKTDIERMNKQGISTFLVGEHLLRHNDVETATKTLL